MKKIEIVGVPFSDGASREGTELAPNILKQYIAFNECIADGGNVRTNINSTPERGLENIYSVIDLNKKLKDKIYLSLSTGYLPIILGGDHSISLGTIAASAKYYSDIAVVYLDAHTDINTDETSPTGNIHGMTLAAAMGIGNHSLTSVVNIPVVSEHILFIGARSVDDGEIDLIRDKQLHLIKCNVVMTDSIEDIRSRIKTFLFDRQIKNIHFSIDIDCLDPVFVPGTGVPEQNGLSPKEYFSIIDIVMGTGMVRTIDLVELNPLLDKDDKTLNMCIETLNLIFKYTQGGL